MKYIFGIVLIYIFSSANVIPYSITKDGSQLNLRKLTVKEIVELSTKKLNSARENHLTLKEKLSFKILQHQYKIALKNHSIDKNDIINFENELNEKSKKFNFGAFLMGLVFSVIGVALIYLLSKDKVDRQSSWIGFGFSLIIILILISLGASLFSFGSFDFPI